MVTESNEPRADTWDAVSEPAGALSLSVVPWVAATQPAPSCEWARMVTTDSACVLEPVVALNGCWLCLAHFELAVAQIGDVVRRIRVAMSDGA